LAEAGFFANEPDFPVALELYREAVERGDPLLKECEWLAEMYARVREGKPPASEAEYRELADWYRRHEPVVYRVDLRFALHNTYSGGPRRLGATRTIEELRMLRAAHPGLE
jgi:hypothetical protein